MSPQRAVGLVLAAGRGGRIGHPKALLEYDSGKSFLDIVAAAIRKGGADVKVVLGYESEAIRARHPELDFVVNDEWEKGGQFSSVLLGLRSVLEDGCDRVLVHPVDMPAVRASTFAALVKANFTSDGAVPEFESATGHPLVLSANAAKKVVGMKNVPHLEAAQKELKIERVKVRDPGVVVNFNAPEIYERLLGSAPHLAPPRKKGGRQKQTA
ncbi:MAG: NTP transferase domain-containing protein [Myxococcaceae bacterium]